MKTIGPLLLGILLCAHPGASGEILLWNGFEGLSQADISDTGSGNDTDNDGIPDGYAINADDLTVTDPLLTGTMTILDAEDRTLERTIFVQPANAFSGMLLVNNERVASRFMPSNQGQITAPVSGANNSGNFIMFFDGGFSNGMMTIIDDLITEPGVHTLSLYAKVFDEEADGDGTSAETTETGDVNENIVNLHVQFGAFLFPLNDTFPEDMVAAFADARSVAADPELAGVLDASIPATGDLNPADVPFSDDWVRIETSYEFFAPGPMAIYIHAQFPAPGLPGALDITAMALDHFVIEGPSFPATPVSNWSLY